MKLRNTVCTPIATLTLIGSLIGGAQAVNLVTWTLDNSTTASATMTNGTVVTATASSGASLVIFDSLDADWNGDFGHSFFPSVTAGNGLSLTPAQAEFITFSFSPGLNNPEVWYSNAINDMTVSSAFSSIELDEATQSGFSLDNMGTGVGSSSPVQSAGRLTITGEVSNFSIDVDDGTGELIRFAIVAVPEPSSTALLGLGGFALILRRRR